MRSGTTATVEWEATLIQAMNSGIRVAPRGKPVKALFANSVAIDMRFPIVLNKARKLNYTFMFAEAYWILSGSDMLEDIQPYCKRYAEFSDNGIKLAGAYGPRYRQQVGYVCKVLNEDPDTRQAVMTIWNRNPLPSKDIPCTISAQFIRLEDTLHSIFTMRSSDIWLGLPYDIFSFTMMTAYIARGLEKPCNLGTLIIQAGNQHLYAENEPTVYPNSDQHELSHVEFPIWMGSLGIIKALEYARDNKPSGIAAFDELNKQTKKG